MRLNSSRQSGLLPIFFVAALLGPGAAFSAQPAGETATEHPIPQSLIFEHQDTLNRLAILAKRPGEVGSEARKALDLFTRHTAREREYILPPLALLPELADGKVTADMGWALAMADRVKADREVIFQEHVEVTDVMNALLVAGERAHDADAIEFAQAASADALNDLEIMEPTVLLIGEYLRAKLPAAH